MIPVKDAVKLATGYFLELFPNAKSVRLEEVEMAEEGKWWNITLSFIEPNETALAVVIGGVRSYKTIQVWMENGELRGIKIRQL